MLKWLRRRLFTVRYPYEDQIEQQRASGLMAMTGALVLLSVAWLVATGLPALLNLNSPLVPLASPAANLSAIAVSLLVYALIQSGRVRAAAWIFVAIFLVTVPITLASDQGLSTASILFVIVPIVVASAMLNRRAILLTTFIVVGMVVLAALNQSLNAQPSVVSPAQAALQDAILALTVIALVGYFLYTFNGWTQIVARQSRKSLNALERVSALLTQLEDKAENAALLTALNFLRDDLKYSFAQFFIATGDGVTYRRLRTGIGARRDIIDQVDDVVLGDASALAEAARTRDAVAVSLEDAPLRRPHFLSGTFDALAVPVLHRGHLLGVLDVQSISQEGFGDDDRAILKTLADGLATTLTNQRLLTDLKASVSRQEAENAALRARLQSLRQSQRSSASLWERLDDQRGGGEAAAATSAAYGFDFRGDGGQGVHIPASDLSPALRAVLETGAHQVRQSGSEKIVSVPISLRGQLLGAMSFSIPHDRVLTDRQIETAKIVAERLALALENRRLFEQTQAQAERERKASEAATQFINTTDLESMMNTAVRTFNEALGAIHTRIHLQPSAVIDMEPSEELSV
jgi:GAF domain-containing protein